MSELGQHLADARDSWRAGRKRKDDRGGATSSCAQPQRRPSANSVATNLNCGKENQVDAAPVKPRNIARRRDMSPTPILSHRKTNGNNYTSTSTSNRSYPISLAPSSFQPSAPSTDVMRDGSLLAPTRGSVTPIRPIVPSTFARGTTGSDESCNPYDLAATACATPAKISDTMPPLRSSRPQVSQLTDITNMPFTEKVMKREIKDRIGASHDDDNLLTVGNIHLHDALHTDPVANRATREVKEREEVLAVNGDPVANRATREVKERDEVLAINGGRKAPSSSNPPLSTRRVVDSSNSLPAVGIAPRRCTVESSRSSTIPVRGMPIRVTSPHSSLPLACTDTGATKRRNDIPTWPRDVNIGFPHPPYQYRSGGESSHPQYQRQSGGESSHPQYQRWSGGESSHPQYQRRSGGESSRPLYQRRSGGESSRPQYQRRSGGESSRPQYQRRSGGESSHPLYQRRSGGESSRPQYQRRSGGESSHSLYQRRSGGEPSHPLYQHRSGGESSHPQYQRRSGGESSRPLYQRRSGGESSHPLYQRRSGGESSHPLYQHRSGGESSPLQYQRRSGGESNRRPHSTQRQQRGSMHSSYLSYGSASRSDSADYGHRRVVRMGERDERYMHGTQRGMRSSREDPSERIPSLSSLSGQDELDEYGHEVYQVDDRRGCNSRHSERRVEYHSQNLRPPRSTSIPRTRHSSHYTDGEDDDLHYVRADRCAQRWTMPPGDRDRSDRSVPHTPHQRERFHDMQRRSYRKEHSACSGDTYPEEDIHEDYYSDEHSSGLENDMLLPRHMARGMPEEQGMEERFMIEDERVRRWEGGAEEGHSDWEGAKSMGEQWDDGNGGPLVEDRIIELVPKTVRVSEDTQVQMVKPEYSLAQAELVLKEQPRSNKENKCHASNFTKKWEGSTALKIKPAAPSNKSKPTATINPKRMSVHRNQFDSAEGLSGHGLDTNDAVDALKAVSPQLKREPDEIQGFLEKQVRTSFIPRWHRRYFQLAKGILQYYRDPSMTEIRKTIDFHKCVANVTETDATIQIVMEPMQGLTSMEEQTNLNLAGKDEAETSQWAKLLQQHILFACVDNARWFLNCKDSRIKVPTYQVLGHDGVEIFGPYTVGQMVEMMWDKTIHPEALVKRNDETSFRALGVGGETERRLVQQWSYIASEGVRTRVTRLMTVNPSTLATTPPYWVSSCGSQAEFFDLVTDPALRDVFDRVIMWSGKKNLRVHQVQRVENGRIWHQYAKALRQAANEDVMDGAAMPPEMEALPAELLGTYRLDLNEFLVWYGTTSHEAQSLARTGFRDAGMRMMTDCAWKSDEYSVPDATGTFALVGCRLVCGRVFTDPSKRGQQGLAALLAEVEADTLLVPQKDINGWWRSLRVLEARRIYPEYVVLYTR